MSRSPESTKPRFVFSAGCLFILLVTAVEVWRSREERPTIVWHLSTAKATDFAAPEIPPSPVCIIAKVALQGTHFESSEPITAIPAPPIATRVAPHRPPPLDTSPFFDDEDELTISTDEDWDAIDEPIVLGDTEIMSMVPVADVQSFPPPQPQSVDFVTTRRVDTRLPEHLAQRKPIAFPANPLSADAISSPPVLVEVSPLPPEVASATIRPETTQPEATQPQTTQSGTLPPASAPMIPPRRREAIVSAYANPVALLKSASELKEPSSIVWATALQSHLARLRRAETIDGLQVMQPLSQIRELESQVISIAKASSDRDEQSRLLATGYALTRRVAVYEAVRMASHPQIESSIHRVQAACDDERTRQVVAQIRKELGAGAEAESWSTFLSLGDIDGLAYSAGGDHAKDRVNVATGVLNRIEMTPLSPRQTELLESPPFQELQHELRLWSTLPVDYSRLILDLESFESNPSVITAERLSKVFSQLRWSMIPQQNKVGQALDSHYRNANVRLTMTERFMNRMLPVMKDIRTPVREQILGARVFGSSASWTQIAVGLTPDPHRIHLTLNARGFVSADTSAFKGPVVVFNRNRSEFYLRKPIIMSSDGVYIGNSTTVAKASSNFLGLRTDYDNYPLIGSIVRRAATQKVFEQRHLSRRILERRVANHAQQNVDANVGQELAKVERRLEEKVIEPLQRMQLHPQALDMHTTAERIVFRGRLSGEQQLSAYTARPRALANNLVSTQIHESSINNVLQQFGLDGRAGNLHHMLSTLTKRLSALSEEVVDEVPEDVEIELASHDALRIYLEDNHVRFTLRIAKLSTARRDWKDFAVSANYTPHAKGFQLELSRDGVVELSGRRLNLRDQIALRAIFGIVFSKNRKINAIHPSLASDPRLHDLAFSQVVIRDGWIGLSLDDEPARVARQRQLETSDLLVR